MNNKTAPDAANTMIWLAPHHIPAIMEQVKNMPSILMTNVETNETEEVKLLEYRLGLRKYMFIITRRGQVGWLAPSERAINKTAKILDKMVRRGELVWEDPNPFAEQSATLW